MRTVVVRVVGGGMGRLLTWQHTVQQSTKEPALATTRTITCNDCGHPYRTIRSNTKRCKVCTLVRNVQYNDANNRVRVCPLGHEEGHEFSPLDSKDKYCCAHNFRYLDNAEHGKCGLCQREDQPLLEHVKVCLECACSVKMRPDFLYQLHAKHTWNKKPENVEAAWEAERARERVELPI